MGAPHEASTPSDISYELTKDLREVDLFVQTNIKRLQRDPVFRTSKLLLRPGPLSCCDEAFFARHQENVVGVSTMSPVGETRTGQANYVGCYVLPEWRKRGIGKELSKRSIDRLQERIAAGETRGPIRLDIVSKAAREQFGRLFATYGDALQIIDHTQWPSPSFLELFFPEIARLINARRMKKGLK